MLKCLFSVATWIAVLTAFLVAQIAGLAARCGIAAILRAQALCALSTYPSGDASRSEFDGVARKSGRPAMVVAGNSVLLE